MKIQLKPVQVSHVETLMEIQARENYCIDTSEMGTGKTITFIQLLCNQDIESVVIIAPENVRDDILSEMKRYIRRIAVNGELYHDNGPKGKFSKDFLHIVAMMSYHSLGGRAPELGQTVSVARGIDADGKKVEVGIMTRSERIIYNKNGAAKMRKGLVATEPVFGLDAEFVDYLKDEKCALWFDEAHTIRNSNTAMNAGSICLTTEFRKRNYPIFFSSGTLGNTEKHGVAAMILQGLILEGKMDYEHCRPLINWCMKTNPVKTNALIKSGNMQKAATMQAICYELYCDVVLPKVSSRMLSYNPNAKFTPNDLLLMIDPVTYQKVEYMIDEMREIADSDAGYATSNRFKQHVMCLEFMKLGYLVTYAQEHILSDPNAKLLVAYNYIKSGEFLEQHLTNEDLPVINIHGKVKARERLDGIKAFNQENTDFRTMIFSMKTMNSGVNLQDKNGDYPRTMIILPSHFYLDTAQVASRSHRVDSASDSKILMPYFCNRDTGEICEIDFYKMMTQKSVNLDRQTNSSVIHSPKGLEEEDEMPLPGNYPRMAYETSEDSPQFNVSMMREIEESDEE